MMPRRHTASVDGLRVLYRDADAYPHDLPEAEVNVLDAGYFAATIGHEIKQPLAAMVTNAGAGLRRLTHSRPDLEQVIAALKRIIADGHRAATIIESISANFKRDPPKRSPLDLNGLIGETLFLVRTDLQRQRIDVRIELAPYLPQMVGDRIQLQQVLMNLIKNAVDSMLGVGGARVLKVKSVLNDDGDVVVSVADTGSGVESKDVERVFTPLFTTKSDGLGIGLSICRSIIEAHDGRLWVTPNIHRGAIFQFVLPTTGPRSFEASSANRTFLRALSATGSGKRTRRWARPAGNFQRASFDKGSALRNHRHEVRSNRHDRRPICDDHADGVHGAESA